MKIKAIGFLPVVFLLLPAFLSLIFPTFTKAQVLSPIRVSGFSSERNPFPLTGFVPYSYFDEDPSRELREALLDTANFGSGGTIGCPVEFKPFVENIAPGSLISNGQKQFEIFFAGMADSDLLSHEADELYAFMNAGGVVYVSGGGYSNYQGLGISGHDGSRYNLLLNKFSSSDSFPQNEVIDFWHCGSSSEPVSTPVTDGVFGKVGSLDHDTFNPINTSSLQSVATGFDSLCMIGMFTQPSNFSTAADTGDYNRTILAEKSINRGYLSVSGAPIYSWLGSDQNRKKYFLNLFALACPGTTTQTPVPFLDLPWDYEAKGLSFSEAALSIGSYFDHEYPFRDVGSVLSEPSDAVDSVTSFRGDFRNKNARYSSHDGYDWLGPARVREGDSVLAAAAGNAQFFKADKDNGACGTSACGNVIVINHENGYQSRYYHLQDNDSISQGFTIPRRVNKGDTIGKVGSTGKSSAPHIHFSVIEDKDKNGNFNDNRPDGLTDPFGWQSREDDPWPNFAFSYRGVESTGNKSYYLWTKPIANLSKELTSNGGFYRLERYEVNFPQGATNVSTTVNMRVSSQITVSDSLIGIGSSLNLNVIDATGNPITTFPQDFTLKIDFNSFDISKYKTDSISIYSSQDGSSWTKEDTFVDLVNKTASATLDHASYFALVGERMDVIAPVTKVLLTGSEGQASWFRSDVKVTIQSQDNENGSGVYYVGYRVDDDYFREYTESFTVSGSGEHIIEFYSVDNDENIEEVKSKSFYIDKTAPELKISYDKDNLNTVLEGVDEFGISNFSKTTGAIEITDKAGNITKITGVFDLDNTNDKISFKSIVYNRQTEKKFTNNNYLAGYKKDTNQNLISIYQNWITYGNVPSMVATDYRTKTQSTRVLIKDGNVTKLDSWLSGVRLLSVYTDNGNLKFEY